VNLSLKSEFEDWAVGHTVNDENDGGIGSV
jgi:hypothetical protein